MYSPKIKSDLIPALYRLAKQKGKPMTKVVDEILRSYLKRKGLLDEKTETDRNGV